jgi:hypothetical protein
MSSQAAGDFPVRGFALGSGRGRVNATLKDGILILELPKVPHAKSVRIEPKAVKWGELRGRAVPSPMPALQLKTKGSASHGDGR